HDRRVVNRDERAPGAIQLRGRAGRPRNEVWRGPYGIRCVSHDDRGVAGAMPALRPSNLQAEPAEERIAAFAHPDDGHAGAVDVGDRFSCAPRAEVTGLVTDDDGAVRRDVA